MKFFLALLALIAVVACGSRPGQSLTPGPTTESSAGVVTDTITLTSGLLPQPMKVTVARPEGEGPFPTFYLLHGHGGDYRTWPRIVDIDSIARARQMIVVCPSGMNSWYWDAPADPSMRMESFIVDELVPAIDSIYPTVPKREARAIAGLSMGGHGSLWLALRHPEIWSQAGSTSGGTDIRPFPKSWNMARWLGQRDDKPAVWDTHTVRHLVDTLPDSILRSLDIVIDCGTEDFFYPVNCQADSALNARRIPHTFITAPGKHNNTYWRRSIHHHIDRFARRLNR